MSDAKLRPASEVVEELGNCGDFGHGSAWYADLDGMARIIEQDRREVVEAVLALLEGRAKYYEESSECESLFGAASDLAVARALRARVDEIRAKFGGHNA